MNVIAHFLNNAIAVSQLFYLSRQQSKPDLSSLDPHVNGWMGLLALVVVYFQFVALNRYSRLNREKIRLKEQLLLQKENSYDPFSNIDKS